MVAETTLEKRSFNKIWDNIGIGIQRDIIEEYKEKTGNSRTTFGNRRRGEFSVPVSEWQLIASLFKKRGINNIWD